MRPNTELTPQRAINLLFAFARGEDLEGYTIEDLLSTGIDINQTFFDNDLMILDETALMVAAGGGRLEVVQQLVEKGANVNYHSNNGWTALIHAAVKGHTNVVEYLLQMEADIDFQDLGEWTALTHAAINNHLEVIKALIKNGANPNITGIISCDVFFHRPETLEAIVNSVIAWGMNERRDWEGLQQQLLLGLRGAGSNLVHARLEALNGREQSSLIFDVNHKTATNIFIFSSFEGEIGEEIMGLLIRLNHGFRDMLEPPLNIKKLCKLRGLRIMLSAQPGFIGDNGAQLAAMSALAEGDNLQNISRFHLATSSFREERMVSPLISDDTNIMNNPIFYFVRNAGLTEAQQASFLITVSNFFREQIFREQNLDAIEGETKESEKKEETSGGLRRASAAALIDPRTQQSER